MMILAIALVIFITFALVIYFVGFHYTQVDPSGKLIVVTGAAQGIGATTAHLLLRRNCIVIACDINKEKLENEFKGVKNVHTVHVDLSDVTQIDRIVEEVKKLNMKVFGVVNNAGVGPSVVSSLVEQPQADILKMTQINLLAPHFITNALYPYMEKLEKDDQKGSKEFIGSSVVNISSLTAVSILPFFGFYCVTKSAIAAYSDQLRRELRSKKIRVSCIKPTAINTSILDRRPVLETSEFYDILERDLSTVHKIMDNLKQSTDHVANAVYSCLFSVRNNGYDGIPEFIVEPVWYNWLYFKMLPHIPLAIQDILIRVGLLLYRR